MNSLEGIVQRGQEGMVLGIRRAHGGIRRIDMLFSDAQQCKEASVAELPVLVLTLPVLLSHHTVSLINKPT